MSTYVKEVCYTRPHKTETHRTILNVGVNLIDYLGEVITPTSDLNTMKVNINRQISDVKSRYMFMDVKDFHLNNQMDLSEYIMIHIYIIPQEFLEKYNLKGKAHNGYIFTWVTKELYGILQAGRIVHDVSVKNLEPSGYHPSIKTPGLWRLSRRSHHTNIRLEHHESKC